VLCGFGEAGAVVTDDSAALEKMEAYRYLGTVNKEVCIEPELNHKIDAIQAALLCESFREIDEGIAARKRVATTYSEALGDVVVCPEVPPEGDLGAIFFDYTIAAQHRDDLHAHLSGLGVETKIRHPILMPDQPAYEHLDPADIPVARDLVGKILSLPCHEKLTDDDVQFVIEAVSAFYAAT